MPKFFIKNEQIKDNKIIIEGQDVNHIKNVLRLNVDDNIQVCDMTTQKNYLCDISNINDKNIECNIFKEIESISESNIEINIFQGLPKADKMELVIQKSVELGAYEITPVEMKRCVVKLTDKDKIKKQERWQKISEVAAKQAGRDIIPKVNNIINIKKVYELIRNYDIVIVAYENEKNNTLKNELKNFKEDISKLENNQIKLGILIGPEGGLEPEDVENLRKNGAKIITLGNRILRTETVALNMISIIMYELEE